jgi:hypothetical protein
VNVSRDGDTRSAVVVADTTVDARAADGTVSPRRELDGAFLMRVGGSRVGPMRVNVISGESSLRWRRWNSVTRLSIITSRKAF